MKMVLKISVCLNLGLLGGLVFVLMHGQKEGTRAASLPLAKQTAPAPLPKAAAVVAPRVVTVEKLQAFHWSQIVSSNDYRTYVAKLRAAGCPEPTVRDIVRGDTDRAFAFERHQLGLDGSGAGPWSRSQENKLIAGLLGDRPLMTETASPTAIAQNSGRNNVGSPASISAPNEPGRTGRNAGNGTTAVLAGGSGETQSSFATATAVSFPVAFQDANLNARDLDPAVKAAIQQAQQQFISEMGSNPNPADPGYLAKWQKAQTDADDLLRASLGTQGYLAYQQELYYDWYQPQVMAANGKQLTLSPYSSSK